ncbi:hypothetical protein GA0115255_100902 [Streptomyces sp. Ncost-T6T-2b]|nr:hypothetical protein GA0115255_100902 [Streptomyces sp. Ncost-T6T-2b]
MTGRGTGGPARRPPDTGERAPAATGCVEGFRGDTMDAAAWLGGPRRSGGQRVVRRRWRVEEQIRPAGARPGSLRRIGRRPGLLVPRLRHDVLDVVCGTGPGVVVTGVGCAVVAGAVPGSECALMPWAVPGRERAVVDLRCGGRRRGGDRGGGREASGCQGGGRRTVRRGSTADQGEDGEEQRGQHTSHPGPYPVRGHLGRPVRSGGVGRWRSTELRICPAPRTTVVDGSSARRTRVPRQRAS